MSTGIRVLPRLFTILIATAAFSMAGIIQLDATVQGCAQCGTMTAVEPGMTVTPSTPVVQLVLGPGTYTITNADTSGNDSGWNYHTPPTNPNWVWAFGAANDATGMVLMQDYVGTAPQTLQTLATQAAVAGATGIHLYDGSTLLPATSTAAFADTLVLAATTAVDFYVLDSFLSDNAGGIALNVTPVTTGTPEPGTFALIGVVLLGAGIVRRVTSIR